MDSDGLHEQGVIEVVVFQESSGNFVAVAAQQQELDTPTARAGTSQASRSHPGGVADEKVTGIQVVGELLEGRINYGVSDDE